MSMGTMGVVVVVVITLNRTKGEPDVTVLSVLVVLVCPDAVPVRNRVVHDTHDAKAGHARLPGRGARGQR